MDGQPPNQILDREGNIDVEFIFLSHSKPYTTLIRHSGIARTPDVGRHLDI